MATQLKQKVPIATTEHGDRCFIEIEWLRALNARIDEAASASATLATAPAASTADHTLLLEVRSDLASLALRVDALETKASDVEERLRALEGGYQA